MDFRVKTSTPTAGRKGLLRNNRKEKEYSTPVLVQTTKAGSIPYLSREAFSYVAEIDNQILQLSLTNMIRMNDALTAFKKGAAAFVGYEGSPTILLLRDPCSLTPQGCNDKDIIPLFTRNGKETLSAEGYMQLVDSFSPDIYQGLSDADTDICSSNKRINKSVERTNHFMDYCYEQHERSQKLKSNSTLFAPIVGGYNMYARKKSVDHALSKGAKICGGYLLEGFHNNGLSATALDSKKLIEAVTQTVSQLDETKLRYMPGSYTPAVVLELVAIGIDMFDSSYAYCAASNYKALTFNFDLIMRLDSTTNSAPFLDVMNDTLKEEFKPLLKNCACLTCRKHTRAYLHHLYKTHELLGPMLIMIHNLHHYMEFFESIRKSVDKGTLPQLIELVKFHYKSSKLINYQIGDSAKSQKSFQSKTDKHSIKL